MTLFVDEFTGDVVVHLGDGLVTGHAIVIGVVCLIERRETFEAFGRIADQGFLFSPAAAVLIADHGS